MSRELATKIRVGLEEFANVRQQFEPLISMPPDASFGVIETSAACAMLHSFYTEVEKILKLIGRSGTGSCRRRIHGTRISSFRCLKRRLSVPQCFQLA